MTPISSVYSQFFYFRFFRNFAKIQNTRIDIVYGESYIYRLKFLYGGYGLSLMETEYAFMENFIYNKTGIVLKC